jgi:hypothetical protein
MQAHRFLAETKEQRKRKVSKECICISPKRKRKTKKFSLKITFEHRTFRHPNLGRLRNKKE